MIPKIKYEHGYLKALVVHSGGQDSTTCLGWAKFYWKEVEAITFRYGQRHEVELEAARAICSRLGIPQKVIHLGFLPDLVHSALTGDGDINAGHVDKPELPASYVPNRNAVFLTLAHAYAQTIKADVVVAGMSQSDYSGYPDCRQVFIDQMGAALNLGSEQKIPIVTPLMNLTKAQTFELAKVRGVLDLVIELSHTCYEGSREPNEWGAGCGQCPACKLRIKGWEEYLGKP